jgi:hypothetical protein
MLEIQYFSYFFSIIVSLATPTKKYNLVRDFFTFEIPARELCCLVTISGFNLKLIYCMSSYTYWIFFYLWLIILPLKYIRTNIRCDCGQYTRTFFFGTLNCINVLYCQWYLWKILLYIDHNYMVYLYSIIFILLLALNNNHSLTLFCFCLIRGDTRLKCNNRIHMVMEV